MSDKRANKNKWRRLVEYITKIEETPLLDNGKELRCSRCGKVLTRFTSSLIGALCKTCYNTRDDWDK